MQNKNMYEFLIEKHLIKEKVPNNIPTVTAAKIQEYSSKFIVAYTLLNFPKAIIVNTIVAMNSSKRYTLLFVFFLFKIISPLFQ